MLSIHGHPIGLTESSSRALPKCKKLRSQNGSSWNVSKQQSANTFTIVVMFSNLLPNALSCKQKHLLLITLSTLHFLLHLQGIRSRSYWTDSIWFTQFTPFASSVHRNVCKFQFATFTWLWLKKFPKFPPPASSFSSLSSFCRVSVVSAVFRCRLPQLLRRWAFVRHAYARVSLRSAVQLQGRPGRQSADFRQMRKCFRNERQMEPWQGWNQILTYCVGVRRVRYPGGCSGVSCSLVYSSDLQMKLSRNGALYTKNTIYENILKCSRWRSLHLGAAEIQAHNEGLW